MQVFLSVLLLFISNCFMIVAWYGHLRFLYLPLWMVILGSWLVALLEYTFHVPGNRIGYSVLSAYQLLIIQQSFTLIVFVGFAYFYLGESFTLRYAIAFLFLMAAYLVAFYK